MAAENVVVTGLGLVTALGNDLQSTWLRLLNGDTAIALRQPLPEISAQPLAMIGKYPATLTHLIHQVITAALEDAQLSPPLPTCGVVVGSSRSYQSVLEDISARWRTQHQSPEGWLEALPHMGAIAAARKIGSQGPIKAPMAACATGLMALFQGWDMVRRGECDRVVVASAEAPITPLTLAGFRQMGALAKSGCYPFDVNREGLVLGEGAAALVLESAKAARHRQIENYGRLLGFGMSADGHHVSAPDPSLRDSYRAVLSCLERSDLTPADVNFIHAHGTGTRLNDIREATLIQKIFPPETPVGSTKGSTGHTLGASGGLGVVFSLLALRYQTLPPTVGLQQALLPLNFVRQAQAYQTEAALCLGFGFGGQNIALALSH